ncbi:MAG: SCO6880 family protein [Acidimicrobiia bacterium]
MTALPVDEPRRYRFAARDRAGVLLGLHGAQCALLGGGLLAGGVGLQMSGSLVAAAVPVLLAAAMAFGRWDGRPAHEWAAPVLGWIALRRRGAHRWIMAVPTRVHPRSSARPECLDGLELREVQHPSGAPRVHGLGLMCDLPGRTLSATLRVRGREFTLLERTDQERVLDAWGSALAGFCRERGAVTRVSWSEWSAPASLDEHLAFVRDQQAFPDPNEDVRRYLELVADAGPLTTAHEVLVTVTVDRTRIDGRHATATHDAGLETLHQEVGLFTRRLEQVGLVVEPPLSGAELALVLRLRTDPSCGARLGRRAETLGEAVGVVSPHNWLPAAMAVDWRHVRIDQSWHRTFWIAEWPRLEVPADWMAPLLLHAGGIRTVTIVYEPVPPSRSRRAVDRDATRLASDEDQRSRHGFRIRAQHRRAESDVLAREAELVAGYPELAYAGFVTITAPTLELLEAQTAEWEQVAAQVGLELRALDGQHDLGLVTALPAGRAPTLARWGP